MKKTIKYGIKSTPITYLMVLRHQQARSSLEKYPPHFKTELQTTER
jgi:hypothetical protein